MISPRAPEIGLPTLRLSSWASSSVCSLMSAASLASDRPRLPAAQRRPALAVLERLLGGRDRPVDVLAPAQRGRGDDVAGRRIDDVEGLPVGRVDGLAADDHRA